MSGYEVNGNDLDNIFRANNVGVTISNNTGYSVKGTDIRSRYCAYQNGTAETTNYTTSEPGFTENTDLGNNIFQRKDTSISIDNFGVSTTGYYNNLRLSLNGNNSIGSVGSYLFHTTNYLVAIYSNDGLADSDLTFYCPVEVTGGIAIVNTGHYGGNDGGGGGNGGSYYINTSYKFSAGNTLIDIGNSQIGGVPFSYTAAPLGGHGSGKSNESGDGQAGYNFTVENAYFYLSGGGGGGNNADTGGWNSYGGAAGHGWGGGHDAIEQRYGQPAPHGYVTNFATADAAGYRPSYNTYTGYFFGGGGGGGGRSEGGGAGSEGAIIVWVPRSV